MRMPRVQRKKRIRQRVIACASFAPTAAARLPIGGKMAYAGCWVPLETLTQAAILLPGVVGGASPADW